MEVNKDKLILKSNISHLGKVEAYLFPNYAAKCYNFLDKNKYIDRLRNTSQLGVISNTSLRTTHTRNDYVILQIYLLNLLSGKKTIFQDVEKKYNLGLSSNIIIGDETISGAEIIEIWILLFNSGHLKGTFSSERGLLKAFKYNKKIYNLFKSSISPDFVHGFVEVVETERLEDVHKFIILFLLRRYTKYKFDLKNGTNLIDFLECLIGKYLFSENKKILKLKRFYNLIRQLSYLFLDSQNSFLPLNFSLNSLLFNFDDYVEDLFDANSYLRYTLNSLDQLLNHDLYYSKIAMTEFALHSNDFYNLIKPNGVKNLQSIFEGHDLRFDPSKIDKYSKKSIHLFFEYSMFNQNFNIKFGMDLERNWGKYFGNTCVFIIEKNRKFHFITMTLVFKGGNKYNHILATAKLMYKIIGLKSRFYSSIQKFSVNDDENLSNDLNLIKIFNESIDVMFGGAFERLFLVILNLALKDDEYYFKFDEDYDCVKVFSVHKYNTVNSEFDKLRSSKEYDLLDSSVKYEINVVKEFSEEYISNAQSKALVSPCSLKLYSIKNNNVKLEIDGAIISFKNKKVHIHLIEAKDKLNGKTDSKKDLSNKINKLNLATECVKYDISRKFKGCSANFVITNDY